MHHHHHLLITSLIIKKNLSAFYPNSTLPTSTLHRISLSIYSNGLKTQKHLWKTMSSLTTDNSEVPDADPGAFKDNTSQPSALHSTIERLKTYIYQIGKVSHNVGEETPILGGMARDFCRNVRSLVKPKERYLDEEIISERSSDVKNTYQI